MKRILTSLATLLFVACAANAADSVYINEVLPNAPGSDTGNEYFELRGTPNMSLAGYYLLSLEGQAARGDVNQFFDLGAYSLGANGYFFARQTYADLRPSPYTVADPNTTVSDSPNGGWQKPTFYYPDNTQADFENGATTILLIKVESGGTPPAHDGTLCTDDLDTDDDGSLDLPTGWTVVDSVGIMDGSGEAATDVSYGAITFRAPSSAGTYLGSCAYGNIIDVPGPLTTTAGTFHVGRKGESSGSTSNDWVGSIVDGTAANPLAFYFYSSSDPAYTGIPVSEMVYGGTNAIAAPLGELSYTPTINGTRFTTNTIVTPGGPVGDVAVDPRDNTTILYTIDNDVGGGIYRAYKVASGNWWVDSAPVVSGLDRPAGLVVQDDGTLWWVHNYAGSLMRLKAPWSANTPEMVITDTGFGAMGLDDDPIDLAFAPASFSGPPGQPGWLVVADAGSDDNAYNALNLQDPATTELNQMNNNFLVAPTTSALGWDNVRAIDALPQSGEVVTVSTDGFISAINGSGTVRTIFPTTVVVGNGEGLAVDPTTGRVWVGDDTLDEVWSVDPSLTPTADIKELSFPLKDPPVVFRQLNMHAPCMAFSTNGAFLVVSDTSTAGGGGRLIIFHSETPAPFALANFSVTNVTQTVSGPQLQWVAAGDASFNLKYDVQRGTDVTSAASFSTIATVTTTSFTDTNAPAAGAFYRVMAKP